MGFFKRHNLEKQKEAMDLEVRVANMREIIIGTDGNNIAIKKAEVSGSLELVAILKSLQAAVESGAIQVVPGLKVKGSKVLQDKPAEKEEKENK